MKKKTVLYMWIVIIVLILIMIPYIQNAGNGPGSATGVYFFMGYSKYVSDVYLYIISMGILEGVLSTLFLQSLFQDLKESEPNKFDLNK
jgi:hypothetical protein